MYRRPNVAEIFLNVLYDMAVVAFELHDKIKRVLVLALI